MSVDVFFMMISENHNLFNDDYSERRDFVHNVGVLASQTRACVEKITYFHQDQSDLEIATIHYKNGYTKEVNISCNSWTAIVRDIFKNID